jgi:serine/threonine-protein phosphatase 4 regulatory subunit 2
MGATLSPASSVAGSVPSTPMFSPIPFLHEDARRSQSRSPPSLALEPSTSNLGNPPAQTEVDAKDAIEPRALGLVDEMDDPGPGHMSDKPVALSSVTTVPDEQERGKEPKKEENTSKESAPLKPEASERKPSRSLFSSLKERFVGSSEKKEDLAADQETMDLDENDDKENQKK